MSTRVRVRFAPSPTGPLHIGGVRTALLNYLFAKKHGGDFILRIEDTDQKRYVEGAEEYITKALKWLNIPYDQGPDSEAEIQEKYGPFRQSERKELYKKYAEELLNSGWAYYAFDTPEELDAERLKSESDGGKFTYNWATRGTLQNSLSLDTQEVQKRIESGEPYVIRFKSPVDESIKLNDIIRGEIIIDTNILDDKVLFKSDGMPTYHLANIVDDHLMEITHVIRGEEWLPSLALHVLLYRAFGWDAPEFAHLPLILKSVGKGKLSKRDGDKLGFPVFPLQWTDPVSGEVSSGYKEQGYYPEAVVNFLAFLGWNPGTEQELFSLDELIEAFEIEKVQKAGARFDPDKTKWYNHQYLQKQSNDDLAKELCDYIEQSTARRTDLRIDYLSKVAGLLKERVNFVSELVVEGDFFLRAPENFQEKAVKKQWKEHTASYMNQVAMVIESVNDFNSQTIEETVKSWISEKELSFGQVMPPLRLALVGEMKGPHVFDIIDLLGKTQTLDRIQYAVTKLG
ncbi:glutamyl-tRNA ligase [Galbibacter marinus]|uniref:Glutamate--tRNA ligase n=1 Tax=Galbibacter marinus TaxID=555500 RepID=K2QPE0_9FLAO|nr:glutamate--tRNA ligase [Galbibacter marinus]EKF56777.1 glutamyl-tRNA ligase [Galbibacter marinus]